MRNDHISRARYKLLTTLLTTYGLGLAGTGAFDPLFKGGTFRWGVTLPAVLIGLVLQGAALYIAPRGEKED